MENREADDEKSLGLGSKFPKVRDVIAAVCDGTLNVKRYRYFFVVPNIFDTNNGTFSGSFFSETSLETFSGTIFFRYRFQYHQRNEKFLVPVCHTLDSRCPYGQKSIWSESAIQSGQIKNGGSEVEEDPEAILFGVHCPYIFENKPMQKSVRGCTTN